MAEKLWCEHEAYIRKFCQYKLQSNPDYVDDCVQEVFLALLNVLTEGKKIEHPKAYLTKVALNKINDIYKQEEKRKLKTVPFEEEHIKESKNFDYTLTEEIDEEEIEKVLDKILASLSESERTLLEDFYTKKIRQKELAGKMNISENALRQQLFRLKRKIIKEIKKFTS